MIEIHDEGTHDCNLGYYDTFDLLITLKKKKKIFFSKFRMEPVMLNFLATTENIRKIRSEHPIYNRGKVPKKAAGNCYSHIPDTK